MTEDEYQTLDQTFCMSPNCKNECGRKMNKRTEERMRNMPAHRTSWAFFCDKPKEKEVKR